MATERVNNVALPAPARATIFPLPLCAGPAGKLPLAGVLPGSREIRVVFGVQLAAPRHVSRTNTWRYPLLFALPVELAWVVGFTEWLGVTATNATKRPELLTDGRIASVPTRAPPASVEISCVEGMQADAAPKQVSRR